MRDPLVQHALSNVWCSPDQDFQAIVKPARITPEGGVYKSARVMWDTVQLPTTDEYYHLFGVGHLSPSTVGLPSRKDVWLKMSDVANTDDVQLQLYNAAGIQFPLTASYFRVMKNNYVVIATKKNAIDRIRFSTDDLFFRFYSNAYFNSQRWIATANGLDPFIVGGGVVGRDITLSGFRNAVNNIPSKTVGFTKLYHNGYLVDKIVTSNVAAGDVLEYIHDRSIKDVRLYTYDDLDTFNSTLDSKAKRIVYPTEMGTTIEFYDDVDFHIVKDYSGGSVYQKGIYFHRNQADAVRQLTHNAFSIASGYVDAYLSDNSDVFADSSEAKIKLFVRHSGYDRELIDEKTQLKELYKLPFSRIREAMTGLNSTVPVWRAENLEESAYVSIMSSNIEDIDLELVKDAYGYNSVTSIMSKTYHIPDGIGDDKTVERPAGMTQCGVFTYDSVGALVASKTHHAGQIIHVPIPGNDAKTVELLSGVVGDFGQTYYGHTAITTAEPISKVGVRFYACNIVNGIPDEDWFDVSDQSYVNIDDDYTISWDAGALDTLGLYPATRLGNHILHYEAVLDNNHPGFIDISVVANNYWKYPTVNDPNVIAAYPTTIPYGTLDVFMDGKTLIEDIDYYVNWPRVVIVKKPPRTPAEGLVVKIRAYGFCGRDMSRNKAREFGFTRDGLLSDNGIYDIRNDRNIRILLAGGIRRREQVKFSEDDPGLSADSGLPYSVTDVIAPVEGYLPGTDTEDYRQASVDVDASVQNYIDQYLDGQAADEPVVINGLYQLYSPFLAKVIHDLESGWLSNGELDTEYTNGDIDTWCDNAEYLLDFDPIINNADQRFVAVHPHHYPTVISLTQQQYTFVEKVIQLYLNGEVDLTPFVTIGSP